MGRLVGKLRLNALRMCCKGGFGTVPDIEFFKNVRQVVTHAIDLAHAALEEARGIAQELGMVAHEKALELEAIVSKRAQLNSAPMHRTRPTSTPA